MPVTGFAHREEPVIISENTDHSEHHRSSNQHTKGMTS